MISSKNAEEVDAIMDIQFLEDFFKRYYEDPVSEICEDDEEYNKLCQKICQDIGCFTAGLHELAGEAETNCEAIGECLIRTEEELLARFNETLNDIGEKYAYIIEKVYLQGALDRERMLR